MNYWIEHGDENEKQKSQIEEQREEIDNIKSRYDQLIHSKSMKLVKPLQILCGKQSKLKPFLNQRIRNGEL